MIQVLERQVTFKALKRAATVIGFQLSIYLWLYSPLLDLGRFSVS
jgi:hypothetical protein